jgi:hypothetical protein
MEPGDEYETDAHLPWSELAAGNALSSLDDADRELYLAHAATCAVCRALESDLAEVVAELAFTTPPVQPPASLRDSIMKVVAEDAGRTGDSAATLAPTSPISLVERRTRKAGRAGGLLRPVWAAAAAVVVVAAVGVGVLVNGGSHSTSVAAQCAKVNCPTVQLTASGKAVATVMMLGGTAYVATTGLPATPGGSSYVLWRFSNGTAVAVAAFSSTPTEGPVKAGAVAVPAKQVGELAISQEHGTVPPTSPTDVLAQGVLSS